MKKNNISNRSRIIELTPILFTITIGIVIFFVCYRAGKLNWSNIVVAFIGGISSFGYFLGSIWVSKLLTLYSPFYIGIIGVFSSILSGAIALFTTDIITINLTLLLMGTGNAFYFNSVQGIIRKKNYSRDLLKGLGIYTFSWSFGNAVGNVISGKFYHLGPWVLIAILLSIGGTIIVIFINNYSLTGNNTSKQTTFSVEIPAYSSREFVYIAWITIFSVSFMERLVIVFLPKIWAQANIPPTIAGIVLFLFLLSQSIAGYLYGFFPQLFYKKNILVGSFVICIFLFIILPKIIFVGPLYSIILFALMGAIFAFFYISAGLYSNNTPQGEKNVGINEALVGLSTLGLGVVPVLSFYTTPFNALCIANIGMIIFAILGIIYFNSIKKRKDLS